MDRTASHRQYRLIAKWCVLIIAVVGCAWYVRARSLANSGSGLDDWVRAEEVAELLSPPRRAYVLNMRTDGSAAANAYAISLAFAVDQVKPPIEHAAADALELLQSRGPLDKTVYLRMSVREREEASSGLGALCSALARAAAQGRLRESLATELADAAAGLANDAHITIAANSALVLVALKDRFPTALTSLHMAAVDAVRGDTRCAYLLDCGEKALKGQECENAPPHLQGGDGLRER